eukprot:s8317_g1.t1
MLVTRRPGGQCHTSGDGARYYHNVESGGIYHFARRDFRCSQQENGLGDMPMPLRVFKPFFVEMRLPYASVRGEDVELIIAVFNYAEGTGTLDAQLQVTLPAEVELVSGEASLQLSVPEAGAARHALRLRPKARCRC